MGRSLVTASIVALLVLISCGRDTGRINVLVIGVDTLRPDHLGCYGYSRDTSPNIDTIASRGVLCENTVSQAPWTLPSFTTVFTSLYPTQHGAVRLGNGLRDTLQTLAGILRAQGYRTGAIVNAPTLKPATHLDRGFEYYDALGLDERLADGTTRDVLAWIDEADGRPFLMFAHYFDPHRPYAPPAPYDRFYDTAYDGPIGDSFNLEGFSLVKSEMSEQMKVLTEADWGHIVALYDGEISFADREIGRLVAGLESRGLRDRTLVVFLSDHGEEFYEHRCYGHGHSLYDELIRVPLIFSLPGVLPSDTRVRRQVRLVDVTPTILDIVGIEPMGGLEGVSLRPLLEGQGRQQEDNRALLPPDLAFAESISQGPELKCIVRYPWKIVHNTVTREDHLFRLDSDPGEHRDLAASETEIAASMMGILLPALFRLSATWYVELAGSETGNRFDLTVKARRGQGIGRINPYSLMDRTGRILDAAGVMSQRGSGSILDLSLSCLKGELTLAFQVEPSEFPVQMDVAVDGRPDAGRVHLGRDLKNPESLPLAFKAKRRRVRCACRPTCELDPPYVLIWLYRPEYTGDTVVDHDERTRQELRALGYIQ